MEGHSHYYDGVTSPSASTPDSVRLALPAEATQISALQRRAWSQTLPEDVAATLLGAITLDEMTRSWELAIVRPPLAELRVLVALRDNRVMAFAAIGPSDDPDAHPGTDALVAEFVVDPPAQHQGHGSRLLNAVADTLRKDGFTRATWWVRTTDDALRGFVTSSGWEADGAHREVETLDGVARLRQVRLHTAL